MSLSKEAQEWNDRQKRYIEREWEHKHMGGADHKEMMAVLNKIERSLGFLLDIIKEHLDKVERENKNPYRYRSQRGFLPKYEESPRRYKYTSSYRDDDPHLGSSSAGSFDMGKEWLKDMRDQMNENFGKGANDGLIIDPDLPDDDRNSDE
jgi:hypothetical protein